MPADGPLVGGDRRRRRAARRPDRRHRRSTCRGPPWDRSCWPRASADATFVALLEPRPASAGGVQPGRRTARRRGLRPRARPDGRPSSCRASVGDELVRRGAWARCVQIVGAFDAAVQLTAAHTGERRQFGRTLDGFQAVQHSLAALIGEVERSRAATALAISAVTDHGFDSTACRLRGDGREGCGRTRRRPGDDDRPPAARRHRRHRRTPAVAGDDAGAKLGRRVRHHGLRTPRARPAWRWQPRPVELSSSDPRSPAPASDAVASRSAIWSGLACVSTSSVVQVHLTRIL